VALVLFWPIGLALLAYMIWGKRMFAGRGARRCGRAVLRATSGNSAFDAYRAETLRRLEEEQDAFNAFLERLRAAKDKAEIDAFMADSARGSAATGAGDDGLPGNTDAPRPA